MAYRFRRLVTIPAGQSWPDTEASAELPPFTWVHVQNRGVVGSGADLWLSLTGPIHPSTGDIPDTIVPAGSAVTHNIGGITDPPATSLHVVNVGSVAVVAMIQLADSPIVYLSNALATPAGAGPAGGAPVAITATTYKPLNAVAINPEAAIWTPAIGRRFRLLGYQLASSVAGNVVLRDGLAGPILDVIPCLAGTPVASGARGNGQLSATLNNPLTATGPAAATLSGSVFGTEE